MKVIHPTTLGRLSCRLQYYWSRIYQPYRKAPAYEFGIAIHNALEKYYTDKSDPVQAFKDYWDENMLSISRISNYEYKDPDRRLGISMMENYLKFYTKEREDFQVLYTEKEVARRIPVPPDDPNPPSRAKGFYLGARVDAVVFDRKVSKVFVLEHKTFDTFYPKSLPLDQQFVAEKFVAEGVSAGPVAGVIYNGLRKKEKEGGTTKLFERHYLYINQRQVEVALHRAYWSLMMVTSSDFKVYPEPSTLKCNMCEFKEPCAEYCRGGDYKFILENSFQLRTEDDSEWE